MVGKIHRWLPGIFPSWWNRRVNLYTSKQKVISLLSEEKRQILSVIKDTAAEFLTLRRGLKLLSGS